MRGIRNQALYYLAADTVTGEVESVVVNNARTWHVRLGHVGKKSLVELSKKRVLKYSRNFKTVDCEQCIMSKSKKNCYVKGKHISKAPLDYAYCDL